MPELILDGEWDKSKVFVYTIHQEAAAAWAEVTTSKAKTDTPVYNLVAGEDAENLRNGKINRIHIRVNPTNAVTFIVRIFQRAEADDYNSNANMLWESPSLTGDVDYDYAEFDIPFTLEIMGTMYFGVEWTGAAGNSQGFISVSGERKD